MRTFVWKTEFWIVVFILILNRYFHNKSIDVSSLLSLFYSSDMFKEHRILVETLFPWVASRWTPICLMAPMIYVIWSTDNMLMLSTQVSYETVMVAPPPFNEHGILVETLFLWVASRWTPICLIAPMTYTIWSTNNMLMLSTQVCSRNTEPS